MTAGPPRPVGRAAVRDLAARLLSDLGDSPDAVAARLGVLGVVGEPDDAWRCPIAQYLLQQVPDVRVVTVGDDAAEVYLRSPRPVTVGLPGPVRAFCVRFDHGDYPGLDVSLQPTPVVDPGTTAREETRS